VRSNADLTWNVVLKLPEYCLGQAQWFMAHMHDMIGLVAEEKERPAG